MWKQIVVSVVMELLIPVAKKYLDKLLHPIASRKKRERK